MEASRLVQSSEQPPAQPNYVLRGHSAQIHAVQFLRGNSRLLTGDADGCVVLWSTASKRAVAVWRAHSTTILGLQGWGEDKIISHGRDNKLYVWQLRTEDESMFTTTLPIDDLNMERKAPWLLHTLQVNALNFCSFAMSPMYSKDNPESTSESVLIATPGIHDGYVNTTSLPSEERLATIPTPKDLHTGMLMAIGLHFQKSGRTAALLVIAGYESGHTALYMQQSAKSQWELLYLEKAHSQPVLSIGIAPTHGLFFTTSADAIIARHPLGASNAQPKQVQTKHAGQQGIAVRSDEMIFATAGWDSRARVYSVKSMKELAVLKWHKEGCYALGFATISSNDSSVPQAISGSEKDGTDTQTITRSTLTVAEKREETARATHWLAAGSKDGKVSMWKIY